MRKSIKLAAAIAAASTGSFAYAICPPVTGVTDVSGVYSGAFPAFTNHCQLSGVILNPLTLDANTLWVLEGKVEIGTAITSAETFVGSKRFIINEINTSNANATTLIADAGATIIGDSTTGAALDYLVINRGSDVFVNGTAVAPVRMTSLQDLSGTGAASGQWGGFYINGYGVTNECDLDLLPGAGAGDCERAGEADTGRYGGASNNDNSGSLSYLTVAYAGFAFDPDTDLNGIAFQAVGSATNVDHVQVHANIDDGVEFYGGAVNVKNVILTDNGDDSFDSTGGWQGKAQYVLISQTGASSDRAFESDNNKSPNNAAPETNGTVANVTILRNNGNTADVVKIRRGSRLGLANVIIATDAGTCFDITDGDGNGNDTAPLTSVNVDCATTTDAAASDTWLANSAGEVLAFPSNLNGYINSQNENLQAFTDMSAVDSFFDATSYSGAVQGCTTDWTTGWSIPGALPAVDLSACDDSVQVPVVGWAGMLALFAGFAGISRWTRRVK